MLEAPRRRAAERCAVAHTRERGGWRRDATARAGERDACRAREKEEREGGGREEGVGERGGRREDEVDYFHL